MKILLVHQHFSHPQEGGAIRSYSIAKFLVNAGHSVHVITRKNNLVQVQQEVIDKINVHYLPVEYSNNMGFLTRIPAYLHFVMSALFYFRKIKFHDFDLNYCISTPLTSGLIGLWFRRRYKLPFIFEVGDLWPDAPIALKAIRFPVTKYVLKNLEKLIYKKAEAVVGLSPPMVDIIRSRTTTPVFYVPNFADTQFFQPVKDDDKPFTISCIGTLGRANELEYMLAAAKECQRRNISVKFKIMGDGARRNDLIKQSEDLNLKNLEFHSFGNKESVRALMNITDAAYISFKKLKILETGCPNKFFDALAAGKLIVLNFGGWLAEYIKRYDCGFTYDPKNPQEFCDKILRYIDNRDNLIEAQNNARRLAEEKFALKQWEETFLKIIENIFLKRVK